MTLHPGLEVVSGLLGAWRGDGHGEYPTIEAFDYVEEVTFADLGKPFLHYVQRTWSPVGAPMHTETGYLRIADGTRVEFVLAQPTGHVELAEGPLTKTAEGFTCELRSQVVNAGTAKRVEGTTRRIELDGDVLTTSFAMAAVGVPMTHHLASQMHRIS